MRHTEFAYAPEATFTAFSELEQAYTTEETALDASRVHACIDAAVDAMGEPPIDKPVVVGFGDATQLWYNAFPEAWQNKSSWDRVDPVPEEVALLESGLADIRRQAAVRLREAYPEHQIVLVGLMKTPRVGLAENDLILKLPIDDNPNGYPEPEAAKIDRQKALDYLYDLPERSPHIAYNIVAIDPSSGCHEGRQLQKRLPIVTLQERLDDPECEQTLPESLQYLQQATTGLEFLVQHNLRLTDICLENIAIDTERNQALWFDFDGLRGADDVMENYTARMEYWPPERRPKPIEDDDQLMQLFGNAVNTADRPEGPIEISEMMYEMGVNIRRLAKHHGSTNPDIYDLADMLTDDDPAQRPSLTEFQEYLTYIRHLI